MKMQNAKCKMYRPLAADYQPLAIDRRLLLAACLIAAVWPAGCSDNAADHPTATTARRSNWRSDRHHRHRQFPRRPQRTIRRRPPAARWDLHRIVATGTATPTGSRTGAGAAARALRPSVVGRHCGPVPDPGYRRPIARAGRRSMATRSASASITRSLAASPIRPATSGSSSGRTATRRGSRSISSSAAN